MQQATPQSWAQRDAPPRGKRQAAGSQQSSTAALSLTPQAMRIAQAWRKHWTIAGCRQQAARSGLAASTCRAPISFSVRSSQATRKQQTWSSRQQATCSRQGRARAQGQAKSPGLGEKAQAWRRHQGKARRSGLAQRKARCARSERPCPEKPRPRPPAQAWRTHQGKARSSGLAQI